MPVASRGPDFLVIGAQRAGTTWLHRVLRQHPSLWLPPVKELHYFDRPEIKRTILSPKECRRVGLKRLATLDPWFVHYWFRTRDDDWYASLFRKAQSNGLVTGEITPAYATLSKEMLRRIQRMNPEIKLIFVMRDPVDRAWSAVNNAARKGAADASTVERAIESARESGVAKRSAYAETIDRIESVFPSNQIQYCFFDDLRDRPKALISELLSFLGVDVIPLKVPNAVNVAVGSNAVPPEFSREMAWDYLSTVQQLCSRFQGPPHKWRARYERVLGGVRADARPTAGAAR